ncbi:uncharacterized protein AKAW2_21436S [Aspergillus luchuensis]|uniref:Uncharacterized protein n=1 Tax=Aspergillus kawachii TaxID=1069201 RepID=A0A7R7W568_ASPKA|nr:uncharacterized protein AKAW2_21436S [Aspergillus luchuensis]BCR96496.1 hypothetical protein AKAW2_21436S [Aspergillus luchuensis]GAA82438.1 hypothetical protein AKAW_00553 [Aspergillus luchuensis IFO 4308]
MGPSAWEFAPYRGSVVDWLSYLLRIFGFGTSSLLWDGIFFRPATIYDFAVIIDHTMGKLMMLVLSSKERKVVSTTVTKTSASVTFSSTPSPQAAEAQEPQLSIQGLLIAVGNQPRLGVSAKVMNSWKASNSRPALGTHPAPRQMAVYAFSQQSD